MTSSDMVYWSKDWNDRNKHTHKIHDENNGRGEIPLITLISDRWWSIDHTECEREREGEDRWLKVIWWIRHNVWRVGPSWLVSAGRGWAMFTDCSQLNAIPNTRYTSSDTDDNRFYGGRVTPSAWLHWNKSTIEAIVTMSVQVISQSSTCNSIDSQHRNVMGVR